MDDPHADLNFNTDNSASKFSSSSSFSKLCKLKEILDYVTVPKLLEPLLPESESEKNDTNKASLSMPLLSLVNLNLLLSSAQSDKVDTNNNQSQKFDNKIAKLNKIIRPRVKKEGYTSARTKDDSSIHQPSLHTSRLFKMVTKISRNKISQNSTKSSHDVDNCQEYDVLTNNHLSQSAYYPSFRCSSRTSTCSSTCSSLSSIFSPVPSPASSYSSSQSSSDEYLYNSASYLNNSMSLNLISNISFNQSKDCPNVNKILKHYRKKFNTAMNPLSKYEVSFKNYPSYLSWCNKKKCVNEKPDQLSPLDQQCVSESDVIKNEIEQLLRSISQENELKQQMHMNGQMFYSIPADIQEIIS